MFGGFFRYFRQLDTSRKLFWLYLVLIFVEGAMRKWYMPNLSNVWMMCREPIVIWTVLSMLGTRYLRSFVARAFMTIGVIMLFTTLTVGHQNLTVALFGFRIWFFHLPYIFIMAMKLDREDLRRMCQLLVLVFLPMVVLYVVQWASPPNTWINAQAGGIIAEGEGTANGAVRPPGVFAHCLGSSYYNPIVTVLFIAATFSTYYRRFLLPIRRGYLLLGVAVMVMLITSVSRGAILQSVVSLIFVAFMLLLNGNTKHFWHMVFGVALIGVLFTILSDMSIDGKGLMDPITNRFETASEYEGGASGTVESRVLEPYRFWNDKGKLLDPPFFGYGIGAGSNFGTQMLGLRVGQNASATAWGLGEWSGQIVTNEMGFLFGTMVFLLRIGLVFYLFKKSWTCLRRHQDILPISLWTMSLQYFVNGNINLVMTLGWIMILMILLMASIRTSEPIKN